MHKAYMIYDTAGGTCLAVMHITGPGRDQAEKVTQMVEHFYVVELICNCNLRPIGGHFEAVGRANTRS